MRVVLQQLGSALFLLEPNLFTRDKGRARVFSGTADAVFYCFHHQITDCELVMLCESPGLEVRLGPVKPVPND